MRIPLRKHLAFVLAVFVVATLSAIAQTSSSTNTNPGVALVGLPGPWEWQNPPVSWKIENEKTLSITASGKTDWFASPMGDDRRDNTPRLLFKPAADFALSAKVTVDFHSQWDSGVLVLYVNNSLWAKLCLEMTIEKHPAIVSVVTRDLSDDNNSIPVSGSSVYLKVAKVGQAIFFYASQDGESWTIIRTFSLGANPDLRIGFSSQSPVGDGCTSVFSQIIYQPRRIDLWSGK